MVRIGPSVSASALTAQQSVNRAFDQLAETGQRLATMQKVRRGSDDPAALIAAEHLRQELEVAEATSAAAERTRAYLHVADTGLGEVGNLLAEIEGHLVAGAGELSPAEREGRQIEIDAALDAIDLIGRTTSLGGRNVLDGEAIRFQAGDVSAEVVLADVSTSGLGGDAGRLDELRSGGDASLLNDLDRARDIVAAASSEVLAARGRGGAFERYTIDATQSILDHQVVALSESLSSIVDVNVAEEASSWSRDLIRVESATLAARFTLFAERTAQGLLDDLLRI